MLNLKLLVSTLALSLIPNMSFAAARVMNPGEAKGQLVYLSEADVQKNSEKFRALSPLSIPVFAELPMELAVVAGAITLKQQNLLSHVQIKSRARRTPNLDISDLEGGMTNPMFKSVKDGDWVHMKLGQDGSIAIAKSTEADAVAFNQKRNGPAIKLKSDLTAKKIFRTEELGWKDFIRVGSKSANYGELARVLNSAERTVVRPGFGIPFYYYQQFIDSNPAVKTAIERTLRDPLMNRVAKVEYREAKLKAIRDLITSEQSVVSQELINELLSIFDQIRGPDGQLRRMKIRSSTNSEDLPDFNGAGLYTSESYKPINKKGEEKSREKKEADLKETLRTVWASIWNLRAYEERTYFRIPHAEVKMGGQVNPTFGKEEVDGVVVTKNIANDARFPGAGVYVEAQRGDKYSVANPEAGTKPEKILILFNPKKPLDVSAYQVQILQRSNVADDKITVLPGDNMNPIMSDEEAKDLAFQSLKATEHFRTIFGRNNPGFSLDIEFKVDQEETGVRAIYLKQARPFID